MKTLEIDISDLKSLNTATQDILHFAKGIYFFAFHGNLGSGKTTIIKQLCKTLGSDNNFSSPTYSIVNEYNSPTGKIYHFDLFRLKSIEDLLDIGFEDYLIENNYCFIEWPDMALDLLPKPYISIQINANENNRYLSAKIIE